jgi:hypothetical protein
MGSLVVEWRCRGQRRGELAAVSSADRFPKVGAGLTQV